MNWSLDISNLLSNIAQLNKIRVLTYILESALSHHILVFSEYLIASNFVISLSEILS